MTLNNFPEEIIHPLLLMIATFFFLGFIVGSFSKRPKIYRFSATGWLKVKDYPIPEEIKEFIATDGEDVSRERGITYNSKGNPIMGYDQKIITHWQALPDVPKPNKMLFLYNRRKEITLKETVKDHQES